MHDSQDNMRNLFQAGQRLEDPYVNTFVYSIRNLLINPITGLPKLPWMYLQQASVLKPQFFNVTQVLFFTLLHLMLPHPRLLDETMYSKSKGACRTTMYEPLDHLHCNHHLFILLLGLAPFSPAKSMGF